jgi:hypothetical protein
MPALLELDGVARLAEALAGVRRTTVEGRAEWRYHGRLGDAGSIEDALEAACRLQSSR